MAYAPNWCEIMRAEVGIRKRAIGVPGWHETCLSHPMDEPYTNLRGHEHAGAGMQGEV